MKVIITGDDWETCYLHEMPERKKQVLNDLQTKIDEDMIIPLTIIGIDVADHSSAVEMFRVEGFNTIKDYVYFSYSGGAS